MSRDWKTYAELAHGCDITTKTLQAKRKLPGWNENMTIAEVRAWLDKIDVTGAEIGERKRLAEMRRAEEEAQIAELKRRQLEGELVSRAEVQASKDRIMTILRGRLMAVASEIRQECADLMLDAKRAGDLEARVYEKQREAVEDCAGQLEKLV